MLNIENARPTAQKLFNHLKTFESFCEGQANISPEEFRELNEEISISTVLLLGTRRYEKTPKGRRLFWRSNDQNEYDLGLVRDAKILRDYPGYNARCSLSLGAGKTIESHIIPAPRGKGTLLEVTLEDGSSAIAPNYRMALRNAVLKMHLKSQLNNKRFVNLWNRLWAST